MSDDFYRALEDRHRGSREAIQERQRVYLGFLQRARELHPDAGVVDVGCGRGEWLELLREHGYAAQGVDLDEGMLQACRERGLPAHRQDAVAFLRGLPDASQIAVTGFHIAEHLPFQVLHELVAQALRVLRPAGLLILETPNPENLTVGACAFYMDPTHQRPLPPPLLAFLLEYHGFDRVKLVRLQEAASLHGDAPVELLDVLSGVSPDYAAIGQKPGAGPVTADDPAFLRDYGLTLNELAIRHEKRWNANLQRLQAKLAHHEQELAGIRGDQRGQERRLEHALWLEGAERAELAERVRLLEERLGAMQASWYWRLGRPLQWAGEQWTALRSQGARERAGRAVRKAARVGQRLAGRYPRLAGTAKSALRRLGLERLMRRLLDAARPAFPDPSHGSAASRADELGPHARRLYEALKDAAASARRQPDKDR